MLRTIMFTFAFTATSVTFAACLPDSEEIGDIGPDSQHVCNALEAQHPESEISILSRKILSHKNVSITISVDGKPESLEYRLKGADWRVTEPALAGSYQE